MSKQLAELCALLIEATYGGLPARLFTILLQNDRLILPQLTRASKLPLRFVQHGLVVLLQQGLAFYHTNDDGMTFYEANPRYAYDIVRAGKQQQIMTDYYTAQAGNVTSTLLYHGYAGEAELLDAKAADAIEKSIASEAKLAQRSNPSNEASSPNGEPPNGANGEKVEDIDVVMGDAMSDDADSACKTGDVATREQSCLQLFSQRMVVRQRDEDMMPESNFNALVAKTVKDQEYGGEVKGVKLTKEFDAAVKKRSIEWRDDNRATRQQLHASRSTGNPLKRGRDNEEQAEAGQSIKRRKGNVGETVSAIKVDGSAKDGGGKDDSPLTWNAFRLNHEKLEVAQRSYYFHQFAARSLGAETASVYLRTLRRIEQKIPRCHDEVIDHPDGEEADGENLDDGPDIDDERLQDTTAYEVGATYEAFEMVEPIEDKYAKKIKSEPIDDGTTVNGIDDDDHVSAKKNKQALDQKRINNIESHMRLLSEDPRKFLTRRDAKYSCDYQTVTRALIQFELDNIILARFGTTARRVIRILYDKGKLDEKQLGTIGLIPQKVLRAKLTAMQEAGYVDTQEVPRDNSRQPSRTIYLWFFDQDRVRKLVLNDLYKAMSRLLQRIKVEQEKVHTVIDKAERTDVKGNEEKYLTKAELDALRTWRECEEKLLIQLSRQDDLVALLRDFLPMK